MRAGERRLTEILSQWVLMHRVNTTYSFFEHLNLRAFWWVQGYNCTPAFNIRPGRIWNLEKLVNLNEEN